MTFGSDLASGGKYKPTQTDAKPPDAEHPSFSLRYVDKKFCLSLCEKTERASFADKLLIWSKMTWAEIKLAHRHGLGHEIIEQLQKKLPDAAPTGAHALAFRFFKNAPMVGFRAGSVFYVVWFDRDFKLYKHG